MIRFIAVCSFALFPLIASANELYSPKSFQPLTSDVRSFRLGDAITVQIVEQSNAQSQADSTADKETSLSAGVVTPHSKNSSVGLNLKRQNTGQGSTSRAGQLLAEISVRIQEVSANGDLVVHGVQRIIINGETQRIAVTGVVRSIDVSSDNIVLSTRLTNAEIEYSGKGFVDRSQDESWISRIFGFVGL